MKSTNAGRQNRASIKSKPLTSKVRAPRVEHILRDLEEAFRAHHRLVDVFSPDTPLLFEMEHPQLRLKDASRARDEAGHASGHAKW